MSDFEILYFFLLCCFLGTADTLVPITTVHLGEPVTLSCVLTEQFQGVTWVHWYKQSAGNTLKLIAMLRKSTNTAYGPGFSSTRFTITNNGTQSTLFILSVIEQDEGMYHCAQMDWTQSVWTGIYLSLKGKCLYTIVQEQTVSDPTRPTSPKTLQCLVLSESENTTCSDEPSVFWIRARSDTSNPDIIYTEEKSNKNCKKTSKNQKKCSYNFSKNVTSSEADTYYCAVATCGEILLSSGPKRVTSNQGMVLIIFERIVLLITLISLAISGTMNIILICYRTQRSACARFKGRADLLNLTFQTKNRRALKTEESVYSQVLFQHVK
uniref:Ig-like domain-containing protein n=1 Tax=Cyprinodon variegatus TaxID=28743 RepID=A0A3Q2GGE9_CYPVA